MSSIVGFRTLRITLAPTNAAPVSQIASRDRLANVAPRPITTLQICFSVIRIIFFET
jgi:hypothetical protein